MRNVHHFSQAVFQTAALVAAVALACHGASAAEDFKDWNLEPGVGQAHLVMVARVASISGLTVVEGAKTDVTLREYRFQPIRRLKGIFQRDQLSMTASDLGIPAEDASTAPPLKEGEFRLLILAQRQGGFPGQQGFLGCVSAAPGATKFEERVPLLNGPDDPLVGVVETLIKVADSRSRRERATLLVERLTTTDGLAAVPLLTSLRLRADWAAADPRAIPSLARLARSPLAAVRCAAVEALRDTLASRPKIDNQHDLNDVAEALSDVLRGNLGTNDRNDETITRVRLAALEALGHLLVLKSDIAWANEWLTAQITYAATYAERAASVTALACAAHDQRMFPGSHKAVMDALVALPLDELPARESIYARAALRYLSAGEVRAESGVLLAPERALLTRLKLSIAARQSLEAEIEPLGRMRSKESLPLLLSAAGQLSLAPADRYRLADAFGRLGDDRAVPVLADWLRSDDSTLQWHALAALENLDSAAAAREVRPLLKSEPHLSCKLRLARLLARHGFADGYALATEHLADNQHTAEAALVLAALDDPRTANDLSAILAAQPDRRWRAAALTGLAAIGDAAARKQLLDIMADDRHPLTADAIEAAGLAADPDPLRPLATLVRSRNKPIALASLVALRRFLSGVRLSPRGLAAAKINPHDPHAAELDDREPPAPAADIPAETRVALVNAVSSLAVDAYVDADLRHHALAVARLLGGNRQVEQLLSLFDRSSEPEGHRKIYIYTELLSALADQAELEGTPLLAQVQAERHRATAEVKQP